MMTMTMDPLVLKAGMRRQWDEAAPGWDSHTPAIRAWLSEATKTMLDMADIRPGHRVLDVAAGAGDQTLDVAGRIGPAGQVLATDLSPAILALARENARRAGFQNVEVMTADCETLGLDGAGFDAGISRLGLMFLPEPERGLNSIRAALKPGAAFCAMVFSGPEANPCISILMKTALLHADLPARDPFTPGGLLSLGKEGLMDQLFGQAGFSAVATTRMSAPFKLPSVDHYLEFIRASASPIQMILSRLDDAGRAAAWEDMRTRLSVFAGIDGWSGPNELLLTVGRA